MITVHFTKDKKDSIEYTFNSAIELSNFFALNFIGSKVCLIAAYHHITDDHSIYIDEYYCRLESYLLSKSDYIKTFYIQLYESYEDAYSVALLLKEESRCCYSSSKKNQ